MKMKTIDLFTSDGRKIVIEYIGKVEHIAIRSIERIPCEIGGINPDVNEG